MKLQTRYHHFNVCIIEISGKEDKLEILMKKINFRNIQYFELTRLLSMKS